VKTSFPPPSRTMKPNPLAALYHFTVPISWALASKGCRSDGNLKLFRGSLGGAAVLLSTLMTSVTCGPRCPRATRNSSVSPGCRVLTPMPASAVAWRKASPDPSESWTKPYPLLGLSLEQQESEVRRARMFKRLGTSSDSEDDR
jgi:hypothetical protein